MKTPGFNAEATLDMPTGQYRPLRRGGSHPRSAVGRQRYAVMPAMDELIVVDERSTNSSDAIPPDICGQLYKCCQLGNSDCCRALEFCSSS